MLFNGARSARRGRLPAVVGLGLAPSAAEQTPFLGPSPARGGGALPRQRRRGPPPPEEEGPLRVRRTGCSATAVARCPKVRRMERRLTLLAGATGCATGACPLRGVEGSGRGRRRADAAPDVVRGRGGRGGS